MARRKKGEQAPPPKPKRKKVNPAPPKPQQAKKVDAAYAPDGKTICPECWSRPDVAGRAALELAPRTKGWGLLTETVRMNGESVPIVALRYPCSNPSCNTIIKVRWLSGDMKSENGPWFKKHKLKGEDTKRYQAGHHTRQGVWVDGPKPIEGDGQAAEQGAEEGGDRGAPRRKRRKGASAR